MIFKKGRYSGYIRPLAIIIDLVIIHILAKSFFVDDIQFLNYILFISISWIFISIKSNFYEVYRFTQLIKIFSLIGKQAVLFGLIVFAFFGFYYKLGKAPLEILKYILFVFVFITVVKLTIYFLLKKYRVLLGGNYRKVVILGLNQKTDQLRKFFNDNPDYGYQLQETFNFDKNSNTNIEDVFDYILENGVDEVYSSIAELSALNHLSMAFERPIPIKIIAIQILATTISTNTILPYSD